MILSSVSFCCRERLFCKCCFETNPNKRKRERGEKPLCVRLYLLNAEPEASLFFANRIIHMDCFVFCFFRLTMEAKDTTSEMNASPGKSQPNVHCSHLNEVSWLSLMRKNTHSAEEKSQKAFK